MISTECNHYFTVTTAYFLEKKTTKSATKILAGVGFVGVVGKD